MADTTRSDAPSAERALGLQEAKEALEAQLRDAARAYEYDAHAERLEVTINFEHTYEIGGDEEGHDALKQQVVALVEGFLARPIVQEADLEVRRVTIIDSDGDGAVAVNVKYEHTV